MDSSSLDSTTPSSSLEEEFINLTVSNKFNLSRKRALSLEDYSSDSFEPKRLATEKVVFEKKREKTMPDEENVTVLLLKGREMEEIARIYGILDPYREIPLTKEEISQLSLTITGKFSVYETGDLILHDAEGEIKMVFSSPDPNLFYCSYNTIIADEPSFQSALYMRFPNSMYGRETTIVERWEVHLNLHGELVDIHSLVMDGENGRYEYIVRRELEGFEYFEKRIFLVAERELFQEYQRKFFTDCNTLIMENIMAEGRIVYHFAPGIQISTVTITGRLLPNVYSSSPDVIVKKYNLREKLEKKQIQLPQTNFTLILKGKGKKELAAVIYTYPTAPFKMSIFKIDHK